MSRRLDKLLHREAIVRHAIHVVKHKSKGGGRPERPIIYYMEDGTQCCRGFIDGEGMRHIFLERRTKCVVGRIVQNSEVDVKEDAV